MSKDEYIKLIINMLLKASKGFSQKIEEETLTIWAEQLFIKKVKPNDLSKSIQNVLLKEKYLSLAAIIENLPQQQLEINIIECLRKAIDYKGLSNHVIYTTGINEGKTCYQASMNKMYELAGAEGVMVFIENAHDFAKSEPGSTDQQFRIKRIKEYYEDLQHRIELNPNLLENKFGKPDLLVSKQIKKLTGGE